LAGICWVSLFVIINSGEKIKENKGGSYVIRIKHYGINAAEMERSITIPLEDALSAIPGIMSVQSSSENSLSNVFIRFKPGGRGRYEAVRDAAQRIYETLPSSVQRPEILSSNNSRVPVWSAAVYTGLSDENSNSSAQILEKIVKPRFESLEGAGEVIVSGTGLTEIYIILDQERLGAVGLEPQAVASSLGMNDSIFSGGSIVQQNREIIITVDGRYGS
jgi:multidrug efflux pump subunit AcrB